MATQSLMDDAGKVAAEVIERQRANDPDAGLALSCGAEALGRKHRVSYSDAKQAIGFFLTVAAVA